MTLASLTPHAALQGDVVTKTNGVAGARSDTVDLARPCIGIHALAAGTVKVKTHKGCDAQFYITQGGTVSIVAVRVYDTGTSVANANLVLLFQE